MKLSADEIEDIRRMLPTHTPRQIAEYIGCHRNTVRWYARGRAVPAETVAIVRERIEAGDSYRRLAADLKRSQATIAAIAASVGLRSKHPALGARP